MTDNNTPADDVVESLREVERFYSTMHEQSGVAKVAAKAAAEIERLRAERAIVDSAAESFNKRMVEAEARVRELLSRRASPHGEAGVTEEQVEHLCDSVQRYSTPVHDDVGMQPDSNGDWVRVSDLSRVALAAAPPQREGLEERKGIYIASKVKHAHRWRLLRDKIGYPIISTWIDEAGEGESQDLADLWARCTAEASNAEVLVFNAERGELFKGAWIELGCALSHGVPVLAVGLDKIDGLTVAHDKRIRHFPDMAALMKYLKPMVGGTPFRALTGKGGE